VHVIGAFGAEEIRREHLLQFLGERRLRHAAPAHAEQLDLVVERRVLSVVQGPHDVVRRGEVLVAIELAARQTDQMRGVQPRVLRIDGHEHLHDVIFRQAIENNRRHGELLALETVDVRVERQQPVLAVDGAQNAFALGHLEDADTRVVVGRLEGQPLVTRNDDRAGNRRQIAGLTTLLVVLHEFVDLAADDLAIRRSRKSQFTFEGATPAFCLPPRTGACAVSP